MNLAPEIIRLRPGFPSISQRSHRVAVATLIALHP